MFQIFRLGFTLVYVRYSTLWIDDTYDFYDTLQFLTLCHVNVTWGWKTGITV